MLKIIGEAPFSDVSIETSDYVPFKFQFSDEGTSPHLYWRTGDLVSTMFEISIDRDSGRIVGGSLLLPGRVGRTFPELAGLNNVSSGAPVVSTNGWPEDRYMDDASPIRIFADSSNLLILFSSEQSAAHSIASNNIIFGISESRSLEWILVSNLSKEQAAQLCA